MARRSPICPSAAMALSRTSRSGSFTRPHKPSTAEGSPQQTQGARRRLAHFPRGVLQAFDQRRPARGPPQRAAASTAAPRTLASGSRSNFSTSANAAGSASRSSVPSAAMRTAGTVLAQRLDHRRADARIGDAAQRLHGGKLLVRRAVAHQLQQRRHAFGAEARPVAAGRPSPEFASCVANPSPASSPAVSGCAPQTSARSAPHRATGPREDSPPAGRRDGRAIPPPPRGPADPRRAASQSTVQRRAGRDNASMPWPTGSARVASLSFKAKINGPTVSSSCDAASFSTTASRLLALPIAQLLICPPQHRFLESPELDRLVVGFADNAQSTGGLPAKIDLPKRPAGHRGRFQKPGKFIIAGSGSWFRTAPCRMRYPLCL